MLTTTQVDAFTSEPFGGNPAAVCLLPEPADAVWMQHVAREMNLSETAFLVRRDDGELDLRWFTPTVEIELCGHGTLASAHVLWEDGHLEPTATAVFHTLSGTLTAVPRNGWIEMEFPAEPDEPPYWQRRLGQDSFTAWQASERGGEVRCAVRGDRVQLCGQAVTVMRADLLA